MSNVNEFFSPDLTDDLGNLLTDDQGNFILGDAGLVFGPDSRHLLPGENPPNIFAQQLANTLAPWTDARKYGLPNSLGSLVPNTPNLDIVSNGSHWQRFVNTFAIELDALYSQFQQNLFAGLLDYPGYTRSALDVIYQTPLKSGQTVTSASGAMAAQYLPNVLDSNGNQILDPNRTDTLALLPCSRLWDFFYGVSLEQQFNGDGTRTTFVLNKRVGINDDFTTQIEWVTVNNIETPFNLHADLQTIGFDTAPIGGAVITVHYTTYDVYYILEQPTPVLFTRQPFFELSLVSNLGTAFASPTIYMMWNELDEIGTYLSKPRAKGEIDPIYQRRLIDSVLYPADSTTTGLRNALATELGLVTHLSWGNRASPNPLLPTAVATASVIALGSTVDPDSILIDHLPLPYYSVVPKNGAHGSVIQLAIPALVAGQSYAVTTQLIATGGQVVPGAVPWYFTSTSAASASGVYDQIRVARPKQTLFGAPSNPWYAGSLQVWQNGIPLVSGADFFELSTTVFSLAVPAAIGDLLQLGYVYDASVQPPELEAAADINTDLAPILRTSVSYAADPTQSGAEVFTGFNAFPPNTDQLTVPIDGSWTITTTVLNAGSAPSTAYSLDLHLPPAITFANGFLSTNDISFQCNVRYIDAAQLWVKNLTDATLKTMLYDARGAATPLLKSFAAEIESASPLEWGQVKWDRTIWHSINERYDNFGFIPHLLDPNYQTQLTARRMRTSGVLTTSAGSSPNSSIAGTVVSGTTASSGSQAFFINYSQPGQALGVSQVVRYTDFVSGIGDGNDLALSIAKPADVALFTSNIPAQLTLNGTTVDQFVIPANNNGAWWAAINPGTYYLNQEEHYFFSVPLYVETNQASTLLLGSQPNTPVTAQITDPVLGLIPMRRVNFFDVLNNLTLTTAETIVCDGTTSRLGLAYEDYHSAQLLGPASDGRTYAISASSSDNVLTVSPQPFAGTTFTVSYVLNASFIVVDDPQNGGAEIFFDLPQSNGILVTYESGSGSNVSGLPLHPYFNPRQSGFVYLSSNFYVPTNIAVKVDPTSVPADGGTIFTIKATVTDANGAGNDGFPVTVLVAYREGTLTYNLTTDVFGNVYANVPASASAQVATVTATMQLFDAQGNALNALIDQTFVTVFSPYI